MNTPSLWALRPQSRVGAGLLLAGLLTASSLGNALAGTITYDNTVFTGVSTSFIGIGAP